MSAEIVDNRWAFTRFIDRVIPPWRGLCGHPIEQTWRASYTWDEWTCPKCYCEFVAVDKRWVHKDGRPTVWLGMGVQ